METKSRTPTGGTTWRWDSSSESESQMLPESWAEHGRHETPDDDQCLFYALEVKAGIVLEYETAENGQIIGLPRRERQAFMVLYIREDGQKAVVRQITSKRKHTSTIKPTNTFKSVIAKARTDGESYTNEQSAKSAIEKLYGGV